MFIPADKKGLCNAFFRNFIGENLNIFLSRTTVLSGNWFHKMICFKSLFQCKNLFNPADKNALCNVFSEILSVKSGYLYIQNCSFFWGLVPSNLYLVFIQGQEFFQSWGLKHLKTWTLYRATNIGEIWWYTVLLHPIH